MNHFSRRIRPYVTAELGLAVQAEHQGNSELAFTHLERAHVLGQASTREHIRVHWRMLLWGLRQRRPTECAGQLLRLLGAATKTAIGLVPTGNTGGSNVNPLRRMAVPAELQAIIDGTRDTEQ